MWKNKITIIIISIIILGISVYIIDAIAIVRYKLIENVDNTVLQDLKQNMDIPFKDSDQMNISESLILIKYNIFIWNWNIHKMRGVNFEIEVPNKFDTRLISKMEPAFWEDVPSGLFLYRNANFVFYIEGLTEKEVLEMVNSVNLRVRYLNSAFDYYENYNQLTNWSFVNVWRESASKVIDRRN